MIKKSQMSLRPFFHISVDVSVSVHLQDFNWKWLNICICQQIAIFLCWHSWCGQEKQSNWQFSQNGVRLWIKLLWKPLHNLTIKNRNYEHYLCEKIRRQTMFTHWNEYDSFDDHHCVISNPLTCDHDFNLCLFSAKPSVEKEVHVTDHTLWTNEK